MCRPAMLHGNGGMRKTMKIGEPVMRVNRVNQEDSTSLATPLSARECDVLQWMKEGKTNWEISQILGITERTVKYHVANILLKLRALSRAHAIARAMSLGLL
jgi:LuxR family transcriptional regulator, quorum-sensing system regulator CviR